MSQNKYFVTSPFNFFGKKLYKKIFYSLQKAYGRQKANLFSKIVNKIYIYDLPGCATKIFI
ncbi:MAG: hypothetical protein D6732_05715 [Methanobacteriota archaeon]|nr:MAG: hypothetical protein D6732_05715 [Euryarchaeota archaeon]